MVFVGDLWRDVVIGWVMYEVATNTKGIVIDDTD